MTPYNSPTPLTDANSYEFSVSPDPNCEAPIEHVPASFARALERRCNALREALEKTVRDIHAETGWRDLTIFAQAALAADDEAERKIKG